MLGRIAFGSDDCASAARTGLGYLRSVLVPFVGMSRQYKIDISFLFRVRSIPIRDEHHYHDCFSES
jgi:hypothetical protein